MNADNINTPECLNGKNLRLNRKIHIFSKKALMSYY